MQLRPGTSKVLITRNAFGMIVQDNRWAIFMKYYLEYANQMPNVFMRNAHRLNITMDEILNETERSDGLYDNIGKKTLEWTEKSLAKVIVSESTKRMIKDIERSIPDGSVVAYNMRSSPR